MNKYQEALQLMKVSNMRIIDEIRDFCNKYNENPFVVLQELVDKETPMKPYKDDLSYSGYRCSNCHSNIYELRSHNVVNTPYCIWCGQKLDWSDENDK